MGATKSDSFNTRQNAAAILFKALGHPARVAIVDYLLKVNACICNEILDVIPLSQPTISQHLKVLKQAGIIKGKVQKNTICVCINPSALESLKLVLEKWSTKTLKAEKC